MSELEKREPAISDNVKFVYSTLKALSENELDEQGREALNKKLPEILKTAQKTREWGFNFMTGDIDLFDGESNESDRESDGEKLISM